MAVKFGTLDLFFLSLIFSGAILGGIGGYLCGLFIIGPIWYQVRLNRFIDASVSVSEDAGDGDPYYMAAMYREV